MVDFVATSPNQELMNLSRICRGKKIILKNGSFRNRVNLQYKKLQTRVL